MTKAWRSVRRQLENGEMTSNIPPHSARTLAKVVRSSLDFTKSSRVVTLAFFGGAYVPSGMGAYVRGLRLELSQDPEIASASTARRTENFMSKDKSRKKHARRRYRGMKQQMRSISSKHNRRLSKSGMMPLPTPLPSPHAPRADSGSPPAGSPHLEPHSPAYEDLDPFTASYHGLAILFQGSDDHLRDFTRN